MKLVRLIFAALLVLLLQSCGGSDQIAAGSGVNASQRGNGPQMVDQILVRFTPSVMESRLEVMSNQVAQVMSLQAGRTMTPVRVGALGVHVLRFAEPVSHEEALKVAASVSSMQGVAYAEPDVRDQITTIPNDNFFSKQWALAEPEKIAGGINAVSAWDVTQGSSSVVVAVVDTGVLPHKEFSGRLLPGYDFISDAVSGNDGNGRDSDASDSGDWILASEAKQFGHTAGSVSSWHGTHVAGIIAASGNNTSGVAGIAWNAKILPVRVLGKGGGTRSDIADGIVWAAGGSVPGAPANPNPAKVINLSLGGASACPATYQNAINYAISRGVTVVVAAGNENSPASGSTPANCQGVITVGATSIAGAKSSFSNYDSTVTISAPGGDDDGSILSTGDSGKQSPNLDGVYLYKNGTSMATPAVAGVAALALSVNPNLTPSQIKSILTFSATRFPTGTGDDCSTNRCGAGILNALGAVRAASSGSVGSVLSTPESGWWWNEQEGGRGFALEIRNGYLFLAGFMYEQSGRPTWFVTTGPMTDSTHYQGAMGLYGGGQTLNGPFKVTSQTGDLGQIRLSFTGARNATINWPNGQSTAITRFDIVANSTLISQSGFTPEAGWWWNNSEPGRGFAIEVQGDNLFVAGFMYDDAGQPTWYVSTGKMTSPSSYSGKWASYANGQALGLAYKTPIVSNPNVGAMSFNFSDSRNAVMVLPNGRSVAVGRYLDYGISTQIAPAPLSLTYANRMLGIWQFDFTIISKFTDYFQFVSVLEDTSNPGTYFAYGYNQFDNISVVEYDFGASKYLIFSQQPESATFDDVYYFDLDSTGVYASGCYFLAYRSPFKLSSCYSLAGLKIANGQSLSVGKSMSKAIDNRAMEAAVANATGASRAFVTTPGPAELGSQGLQKVGNLKAFAERVPKVR
jgi:serine protease